MWFLLAILNYQRICPMAGVECCQLSCFAVASLVGHAILENGDSEGAFSSRLPDIFSRGAAPIQTTSCAVYFLCFSLLSCLKCEPLALSQSNNLKISQSFYQLKPEAFGRTSTCLSRDDTAFFHLFSHRSIEVKPPKSHTISGWWFGTWFFFPYIGNDNPKRFIFFRGVGIPPTRESGKASKFEPQVQFLEPVMFLSCCSA